MALAATSETRARQATSQIDELLAAQKRAREEKKRLANEMKNAKRRKLSSPTPGTTIFHTVDLTTPERQGTIRWLLIIDADHTRHRRSRFQKTLIPLGQNEVGICLMKF